MPVVAILGAGPIGAAVAQRLAQRGNVREIRLIDAQASAAEGKALDIRQSGPIERFDTRLSGTSDVLAASGASVVVFADSIDTGEWDGPNGLDLARQLTRAGSSAAFVFAGPKQTSLMERCYRELHMPAPRLIGTAPSALVGAAQALAGLELNLSSVELTIAGRPPELVIGWSAATAGGSLVIDRVPAHRLMAISASVRRFWPPGPQAIGAATARVVEALIFGSRRLHPAMTIVDGELGVRGAAVMLPLELGHCRVLSHVIPSLSPQEMGTLLGGTGVFSTE